MSNTRACVCVVNAQDCFLVVEQATTRLLHQPRVEWNHGEVCPRQSLLSQVHRETHIVEQRQHTLDVHDHFGSIGQNRSEQVHCVLRLFRLRLCPRLRTRSSGHGATRQPNAGRKATWPVDFTGSPRATDYGLASSCLAVLYNTSSQLWRDCVSLWVFVKHYRSPNPLLV